MTNETNDTKLMKEHGKLICSPFYFYKQLKNISNGFRLWLSTARIFERIIDHIQGTKNWTPLLPTKVCRASYHFDKLNMPAANYANF